MKIEELRDKSEAELKTLLDEQQLNQFRLRMAKATGQLTNSHQVRSVRRGIARIKTILSSRGGA